MARAINHCIHRQSLEVAFGRPGQEPGMQDRVAAVYYDRIVPRICALFDEYGAARYSIRQLTIDCGRLHEANWEEELAEAVINGLRDELSGLLRSTPEIGDIPSQRWAGELAYFLKQGRWKWDTVVESAPHLEQLFRWDRAALDTVVDTLRASDDAVDRLLFYFSADFVRRLSDALQSRIPTDGRECVAGLGQAGVTAGQVSESVIKAYVGYRCQSTATKPFATAVMEMVWPELTREAKARIVEQFVLSEVKARRADAVAGDAANGATTPEKQRFPVSFRELIAAEFPESAVLLQYPQTNRSGQSAVAGPQSDLQHRHSADDAAARTETDTENPMSGQEVPPDSDEAHTWYIRNAGLVLVYPFIEPLLQNLGFMDGSGRLLPDHQRHAPTVLQHLVYGSAATDGKADEMELALNKVLCGLSPTAFVDPTRCADIPAIQLACNELLTALIGHWSVLRNTSIEGLQETFLQREGKLTVKDSQWRLHVESRGTDVLLSSLPWSIGVIRLPWMDQLLHVEWIG